MYSPCMGGVLPGTKLYDERTLAKDSLIFFQDKWPTLFINYYDSIYNPIIQRINDIIKIVATEHGYSYVIDCSYKDFEAIKPNAEDVTIWVREKLDLK